MTNKTTQSLWSRVSAHLKRSGKSVRLSDEAVDDLSKSIQKNIKEV